jgi:hypothetical protein
MAVAEELTGVLQRLQLRQLAPERKEPLLRPYVSPSPSYMNSLISKLASGCGRGQCCHARGDTPGMRQGVS